MNENPASEKRRRKYIDPAFQRAFILQFAFLMVLGCVAFTISIYFYAHQTLTTAFVNSRLRVMSTADFLFPALILMTLVVAATVAFVTGFRLLLFSHKIAGPLYRLEKTAEAVGRGDLNLHVRLREGDELKRLAQSMDEMVQDLRARAIQIKEQNDRLREILQQAEKIPGVPPDFLKALRETQKKLSEAVSHFRV